jgi:hypothetical protein
MILGTGKPEDFQKKSTKGLKSDAAPTYVAREGLGEGR